MKKIFLILITISPLFSSEKTVNWPLNKINIIKTDNFGWSDKFFSYAENRLFIYYQQSEKTFFKEIHTLNIKPEFARHFPLIDVDVITVWSNTRKKLEILIFDKNNNLVTGDMVELVDQIDDLQIRFGQGRRPALLLIKNSKDEHKASLWFDDREQVIFLQSTPIMASTLDWVKLSAYIVTREGTKSVVKVWKKGLVSSYELPFLPIFARFTEFDNQVYLLAIDSKSTLWSIRIDNSRVIANKILVMKDLAYVKQIYTISLNNNIALVMHSPFNKKMYALKSVNIVQINNPVNVIAYSLLDEDTVLPGRISGNLAWLESNSAQYAYLTNTETKNMPIMDLNWKVETKAGYPEILFSWSSLPANKKYEYRFILDNNPDSLPLPEYRVKENKLALKLTAEGDYYLHIQARDLQDNSESIVYHFPVFWKYRPSLPIVNLSNEITPYVISGNTVNFVINNIEPLEYFAEINNIPVHEPAKQINAGSGEVQINQQLKPGRYYLHIRSRDSKTNSFSPTLHYLFFYQTYVTEFTVGANEYNRDMGKLNMLINQYQNASSIDEKDKILKELETFKKNLEEEITK